jgi:hypothetical protein
MYQEVLRERRYFLSFQLVSDSSFMTPAVRLPIRLEDFHKKVAGT